jgi:hypothetical protein
VILNAPVNGPVRPTDPVIVWTAGKFPIEAVTISGTEPDSRTACCKTVTASVRRTFPVTGPVNPTDPVTVQGFVPWLTVGVQLEPETIHGEVPCVTATGDVIPTVPVIGEDNDNDPVTETTSVIFTEPVIGPLRPTDPVMPDDRPNVPVTCHGTVPLAWTTWTDSVIFTDPVMGPLSPTEPVIPEERENVPVIGPVRPTEPVIVWTDGKLEIEVVKTTDDVTFTLKPLGKLETATGPARPTLPVTFHGSLPEAP